MELPLDHLLEVTLREKYIMLIVNSYLVTRECMTQVDVKYHLLVK